MTVTTVNSALLTMPIRLVRLATVAALVSFTARTVSADLLYNPVVVVVSSPAPSSAGATTSISIYQQGVANQTAPISTTSYLNGALDPVGSRLVNSGTNVNEGTLTNNPGVTDAAAKGLLYGGTQYVYNAGYDAPFGTPNIASTTPTTAAGANAPRAFGQTNVTNNIASAATVLQTQLVVMASLATPYDNSAIRGAVGDDTGTARYTAGTTTNNPQAKVDTGGFRNFGANTQLTTPQNSTNGLHNTRTIELLAGGLFGTGGNSTFNRGIYKLNPAGAAVNATSEPRYIDTGQSSGPREFALFDDPNLSVTLNSGYDTAYIADDTFAGGIQKWTWDGAAWSLAYILADGTFTTYRGLAGQLDAVTNLITLYTTEYDSTFSRLQQVTDNGAGSTFTTLATMNAAVPGDYNQNGIVDTADYVVWRKNDGTANTLPNDPTPGVVDSTDYDLWRANFGNRPSVFRGVALSAATGAASGSGLGSTVPEPACCGLAVIALFGGVGIIRRRRSTM